VLYGLAQREFRNFGTGDEDKESLSADNGLS